MKVLESRNLDGLPSGWAWTRLGNIGNYWNGRGFKKSEWRETGRQIIRIQDLTGTRDKPNYFQGEVDPKQVVRHGDLLVSWAATLGVYVWRGEEAVLNQHIFRVDSFIDRDFHYYLIAHVLNELRRQTHGSGMVHITRGRFDSTHVPLPPLAEQRRIAAAIEEQFSRIDAGAEALQRARRNLQRMRATVLLAAITGRLVQRDPSDDSAADLLERLGVDGSLEVDRVSPPLKPPDHWGVAPLGRIAETRLGKMLSKAAKRGLSPKPYLRNLNVQWWRFELTDVAKMDIADDEQERFSLRPGDLMVCEGGYVGRCAVWRGLIEECYYQKALHRVRPRPGVASEYLAVVLRHYAENRLLGRFITGTTIEHLPQEDIRNLPIPLPSTAEQARIVAEVDRHFSLLDDVEAVIATALSRGERIRKGVLQEAFNGRLVSQDRSDEPASVLLQRIKLASDGQGAKDDHKPKGSRNE